MPVINREWLKKLWGGIRTHKRLKCLVLADQMLNRQHRSHSTSAKRYKTNARKTRKTHSQIVRDCCRQGVFFMRRRASRARYELNLSAAVARVRLRRRRRLWKRRCNTRIKCYSRSYIIVYTYIHSSCAHAPLIRLHQFVAQRRVSRGRCHNINIQQCRRARHALA